MATTGTTTATNSAADRQREKELLFNARTFAHPKWGTLTLRRPTPEEEFLVAEYRTARWNADIEDPKWKFRDELDATYANRGVWSEINRERRDELSRRVGEAIGYLEQLGFKSFEDLVREYEANITALRAAFVELSPEVQARVGDAITRVYDLTEKPTLVDRTIIEEAAPTTDVAELLSAGEDVRVQLDLLGEMTKVRKELVTLQTKEAQLYSGCIESRADRAEEIARLYYCVTTPEGGRVTPTVDALWKADPKDIDVLALEMSYFVNGVTDDFRASLQKFGMGFTRRLAATSDSSVDSPDQPPSNSDGASPEAAPTASSPATA